MESLHLGRCWETETLYYSQVNAQSQWMHFDGMWTEPQKTVESSFCEASWGPWFSDSEEMNHKKQWWAVKTSVCKARGRKNASGFPSWITKCRTDLRYRQLCGNPSTVTVCGHPLWAEPRTQEKERWLSDKGDKTGKRDPVGLLPFCSGWVYSKDLRLAQDLLARLNPGDLFFLLSLWAEWVSGRATDTVLLRKDCQGQIKGWFNPTPVYLCQSVLM